MKRALVVTGGKVETEFCRDYISRYSFDWMVAVDSGLTFFYREKIQPDLIVGDFDSVRPEALAWFEQAEGIAWMRLVPEKDDTDTEAAVRRVIADQYQEIHILGGTGSRIDHMMANIGILGIGLSAGVEILLVDECNRVRMRKKSFAITREEQYGRYVSLLPFSREVTGVTLRGMKYPLQDATLFCDRTIGISNEIVGEQAEMTWEDGILLVMETRD